MKFHIFVLLILSLLMSATLGKKLRFSHEPQQPQCLQLGDHCDVEELFDFCCQGTSCHPILYVCDEDY
ncbi:hypothetical protein TTHERM_00997740 (macronuclear) [Tetrahymena thermophila SB210]|uniref:Transmembrane protein n=1 Tax=Tetrahymena thermophila (strain SB210) TaxID=312017 RepID=Q23QY7_TETTS|nr:hypothetical protein TTHERM_00997740 [Tetrahymena thermophila SB210]EAR98969.2 hypothetical protein TTHERM_00997740 [Tetrahymena thermophila SB210]|eukprot:XP_001019214.2 hypothetical protein TTHERM_00997740 [Tetrahymena thermophila SB210]